MQCNAMQSLSPSPLDSWLVQYQDDAEMQEFFANLLHVKYDYTGDGPLGLNQVLDDHVLAIELFELDGSKKTLGDFVAEAKAQSKPLAILAGSWT
jgi:hypothetical protein